MLRRRSTQFENTEFYKLYTDLLEDADLVELDKLEFYQETIAQLLDMFGCDTKESQPTEIQMETYIVNCEPDYDGDKTLLMAFIKRTITNAYTILKELKTNRKKELKKKPIIEEKLKHQQEKLKQHNDKIKHQQDKLKQQQEKLKLKEDERQYRVELKQKQIELKQKQEKDKLDSIFQKQIWSSTICICDKCNISYTQANRSKHLLSDQHITRVEAIDWIRSKIINLKETSPEYSETIDIIISEIF